MDVLTPLLTVTSTSVAKFLLKKYFASAGVIQLLGKDLSEGGQSVGEGLVDIAAAGFRDRAAQREALRLFEGIADKIILQLTPLFEEAQKHGHVNFESVARELATALEGKLSAELLLAKDLDPRKLANAFRDAHPLPTAQFSEAETALYERALYQSARYLVSVATQLPQFDVKLAAAQLQQIGRMQDDLTRALESIRKMEEHVTASSPDKTHAQFEADYRQVVSQSVDELELFGVDVEPQSKRYRLSVAYISLSLQEEEASEEEESTLISAHHLLQQLKPGAGRLLIRGEAGSGKSTLFRWAALMAATGGRSEFQRLGGQLSLFDVESPSKYDWYLRVPFLIRLRDCKDGRLPHVEDFTKQIAWTLEGPPSGWMRTLLNEGRALILLDGVDEVPNRDRGEIYKAIEQLVVGYPTCYFLLSTRPSAVERGWLRPLGFREADINPLSEHDRDQLIDRWHEAVAKECESRGKPGLALGRLAEKLKGELRENPTIARLAANPLLAAMICALHRERNQRLPESQAELCEALCHMLLHRREHESHLKLEGFPEAYRALSYPQKRAIVTGLAIHMVRNEVSTLDRTEALIKVAGVLDTIPGRHADEARIVLDALIERSGMLREARPGAVDFIHNTFKEYLAGDLLAQQREDGFLATKVLDPNWKNILVFSAACGESTFVKNLATKILGEQPALTEPNTKKKTRKSSQLSTEQRQRVLMAIRLRSVAQFLDKGLEARIESLQNAILPPRTMSDAEALASAGNAIVTYMKYQPSQSARCLAACVRTLRLINTPAARAILKEYLAETKMTVLEELAQATNPLELKWVQDNILRGESVPDAFKTQISDLSPLKELRGLQLLNLAGSQVTDLSPLAELRGLQSLYLTGTQVTDLSPLAELKSLRSLYLRITQVTDLSPLAELRDLQLLYLEGTLVTDLSPLAELKSLQSLDLAGTQVTDLSPLAELKSLLSLNLTGTQVTDLSPLAELKNLQSLLLVNTQVTDFSPLAELKSLRLYKD